MHITSFRIMMANRLRSCSAPLTLRVMKFYHLYEICSSELIHKTTAARQGGGCFMLLVDKTNFLQDMQFYNVMLCSIHFSRF